MTWVPFCSQWIKALSWLLSKFIIYVVIFLLSICIAFDIKLILLLLLLLLLNDQPIEQAAPTFQSINSNSKKKERKRERERERESIKNNFYFWFMLIGYLEASVMESNIRSVIIWDIILKSMDECTN